MILWIIKELPNKAYLWLGYHFLDIGFKDFIFAIYQTQDLHGVNLSMKIWYSNYDNSYSGDVFSYMNVFMHQYFGKKSQIQKMNT
jgi:hypothetical protein